jgi:hypothetical protein
VRVAIYEPYPRVGGSIIWSRHAQAGLHALGHSCDVVASTKSGKTPVLWKTDAIDKWQTVGNRWAQFTPDVVVKQSDLFETLRGYDLVILPDAWSVLHDNRAAKAGVEPDYLTLLGDLGRVGVPWTTVLHGTASTYATAKFTDRLFHATPGFSRSLLTHFAVPSELPERFNGLTLNPVPLPYAPVHDLDGPFYQGLRIGMTGRLVPIKGAHLLVGAVDREAVPFYWSVDLAGGADVGYGDSYSHQLWRALTTHGWDDASVDSPNANPKRALPWKAFKTHRPIVRYTGAYRHGVDVASQLTVHATLTNASLTSFTEYATLEAIDAGCVVVAPARHVDRRYHAVLVHELGKTTLRGIFDESSTVSPVVERVANALQVAVRHAEDPVTRSEDYALYNRRVLREIQDPATVMAVLLREAMK